MRILAEVAERGSIAGAAQTLHLTASAVSQHIAALERELGVALLERGPRSTRLTSAGRALADEVPEIVRRLREVEANVRAVGGLHAGAFRFGAFTSASSTLAVPAMNRFTDRHPGMRLGFVEGDPEDCVPRLRDGELDLVVTYEYDLVPLPADTALRRVALMRDPFRVALPGDHPLAAHERIRLDELRDDRWIAEPRGDCHPFTLRACAAAGFDAHVDFHSSDYRVSMQMLKECGAVALIPRLAGTDPPPGVVVRTLDDVALGRRIDATHRVGGDRLPAVAAMLDALREVAARAPTA